MDKRTKSIIKRIAWDYNIPLNDIYDVILRKKQNCYHWDFEKIFIRLLERVSWYDIIYLIGIKTIKKELTKSRIKLLFHQDQRQKYEDIRKILSGETVSFTEWGPAFNERIKSSLFSDRWYSTQ